MTYTGKILAIAYPDTFVRFSDDLMLSLLSYIGIGKNKYVKAGHAAMVLVENATGKALYYDFGRYVTPEGKGRVRSAETDVELQLPYSAEINTKNEWANVDKFLMWLSTNLDKTHGSGRMVAAVCDHIDYDRAFKFVTRLQQNGSMSYRAFGSGASSNCSRLVTDTILASTDHRRIRFWLTRNNLFSPSPIGNAYHAALSNPVFEVDKGQIRRYTKSVLRENTTNYFDQKIPGPSEKSDIPDHLEDAHYLSGIGCGAYFKIFEMKQSRRYIIERYTDQGDIDFRGIFESTENINMYQPYQFTYDSHCLYCHILQNNTKIRLDRKQILDVKEPSQLVQRKRGA